MPKYIRFLIIFFLITACSQRKVFNSNYYCQKLKISCIRKNHLVTFKTSKGDFQVKLNGEDYPLTVNNFIENIENNIYENQKFYKIINFPQVKLIHGGIYKGNNLYKEKNQFLNKIRPSIPLEISLKKDADPRYKYQIDDPSEFIQIKNFFERGSMAMVKRGEKKSSSTEFFLVTNGIPELDGRYSIFGRVVKGFKILNNLNERDFIYEIKISN